MTKRKIETLETSRIGNSSPARHVIPLVNNPKKKPKQSNTEKKPQGTQLKWWFMTWNNYPENGAEIIETLLGPLAKKYLFQEEVGDKNGVPHLQGNFQLYKKMRWSEFRLPNTIHWEKTDNIKAAFKYCGKEFTRTGKQYSKGMPKTIRFDFTVDTLHPWQKTIYDMISVECMDNRTINWYWERDGDIGKSQFVKFCCHNLNAIALTYGKASDLMNMIFNADMDATNIIFIDIPRVGGNRVSYTALENIKNGMCVNTKFETGMKIFNAPHVVIFANEPPDMTFLSADRWNIVEL